MTTLQIMGWLNVVAFVAIVIIISFKKRNRMAGRLSYQEMLEASFINNNKYLKWLNPFKKQNKTRFNAEISMMSYWIYTVLGMGISLIYIVFVLRFYVLLPATLLVGLSVPAMTVYYKRRKMRDYIYECLDEYINSTANSADFHGEPINALKDVVAKNFIQEPVKSDVQTIILSVENGMSLQEAFKNFENLYENNSYLEMFHQNLIMQFELGGKMSEALMESALDFGKALSRRVRAKNAKATVRSNFTKLLLMVAGVPLILMGFTYDYYLVLIDSPVGKSVFTAIILAGVYSGIQIERKFDQDMILNPDKK